MVTNQEYRDWQESQTPLREKLLQQFVALVPEFEIQWNSSDNLHREDDGTFTRRGVCMEFSRYFRDNYEDIPKTTLKEVFQFVERSLVEPGLDETQVDIALRICFLKFISSHPSGEAAMSLMGPKSRAYFDHWHLGPPYLNLFEPAQFPYSDELEGCSIEEIAEIEAASGFPLGSVPIIVET